MHVASAVSSEVSGRTATSRDLQKHRAEYDAQGYTVLRGFFSPAEMEEVIEEIKVSGTRVDRPDILDQGELKFYPNAFARSAKLQRFLTQQRVIDLLVPLLGPSLWVRWDQAVAKGPGAGDFPWHQDNAYSRVPDAHVQLWVALSRMTKENGGLWIAPRSHRRGRLRHRWNGVHAVYDGVIEHEEFIGAEVGDIVLFSSYTLHATKPNVSDETRWAYVAEYLSLRHWDPLAKPPHFIAARNGKPCAEWVDRCPGRNNPWKRAKYYVPLAVAHLRGIARRVLLMPRGPDVR